MSTGLDASIATPGKTAPVVSLTIPAKPLCENATPGISSHELGDLPFVYTVAPHHPLATAAEPITDEVLLKHRAVAVSDSAQQRACSSGSGA